MKDSMEFWIIPVFMIALLGFALGLALGVSIAQTRWQEDAVKQGMAEWSHNEAGSPKFRWIRPPDEK